MGQTTAEKIIAAHTSGEVSAGKICSTDAGEGEDADETPDED